MMTESKYILAVFVLINLFSSCKNELKNHDQNFETSENKGQTIPKQVKLQEKNDTIEIFDAISPGNLLQKQTYHEDEVAEHWISEKWFGLFYRTGKYYVQKTEVNFARINDPILDDDSTQTSGWDIQPKNNDSCIFLMNKIPEIIANSVSVFKLKQTEIYPGKSYTFDFLENEYTFAATGKTTYNRNERVLSNYKLYLTTTTKGKTITVLINQTENFDDAMIEILFAGDIDNDGFLDLLIDESNHYNACLPTLYLSKPAGVDQILKRMTSQKSVGC
jgi:hypothetical protein